MQITQHQTHFKIAFDYRPALVEDVKQLPERTYNAADKTWLVPTRYRIEVERFAHAHGFTWAASQAPAEPDYTVRALPELTIDIPMKITPRDYQRGAIAYNIKHRKVICADDMGLGKTLEAIAALLGADKLHREDPEKNPAAFPCLVICPSSVKLNWLAKWQEYTGRNMAMILEDNTRKNWHLYFESGMSKVFITNYESLKKFFVKSIDKKQEDKLRLNHILFDERIKIFKSVILDEFHKCKDSSTMQAKLSKGVASGKNFIFGLTGTPVINKPKDLISQLGIIEQMQRFGGYTKFVNRFCAGYNEASNLKELNFLLNQFCFYRRSKQEVAKELPPKTRQVVACEITNRQEYLTAENDLITYLKQYKEASDDKIATALRGEIMVKIGILKNISARGKMAGVMDYIDDTIEQGEKLVLFVHLKEVAAMFKKHYPNAATILGDDSLADRQTSIRRFKDDSRCMLMICSIKAAGLGVDGLQHASSNVVFIELPWHAADCDQCEDRLNRIGQTKSVNAIYFLGRETIDNDIYKIIERKRAVADEITGNTDKVEIDFVSEFAELFNK